MGPDTLPSFAFYLATRKDNLPWLFVSERGAQLTRHKPSTTSCAWLVSASHPCASASIRSPTVLPRHLAVDALNHWWWGPFTTLLPVELMFCTLGSG